MTTSVTRHSPFENYRQLLAKIDHFAARAREKYFRALTCAPGCARCCVAGIHVWRVEYDHICRSVIARSASDEAIPAPLPSRDHTSRCTHLDADSRCSIYDVRPVVCRLWGLPIFIPAGRVAEWTGAAPSTEQQCPEGTLTCCELNFTASPTLEALPLADALNAETVIQTLAAINHVYCKDHGLDPTERLSLDTIRSPC